MANETKAFMRKVRSETWNVPRDCLCIPAAEARKWLPDVIAWASDYEVSDWAQELLAKLPEEE